MIQVRKPLRKTVKERDWVMSHRACMLKTTGIYNQPVIFHGFTLVLISYASDLLIVIQICIAQLGRIE